MPAILSIILCHLLTILVAKNLDIKNYLSYLLVGLFSLLIVGAVMLYLFNLDMPKEAFKIFDY